MCWHLVFVGLANSVFEYMLGRVSVCNPLADSVFPGSAAQRRLLSRIWSVVSSFVRACRRSDVSSFTGLGAHSVFHRVVCYGLGLSQSSFSLFSSLNRASVASGSSGDPSVAEGATAIAISSVSVSPPGSVVEFPELSSFYGMPTTCHSAGAIPLVADKVSLPDSLEFTSLVEFLPPAVADLYATPGSVLLPPDQMPDPADLKRPRVFAMPGQYVALCRRLLKIASSEASSHFYTYKFDLSDYYHRIWMPDWMQPYFCLPPLSLRDLGVDGGNGDDNQLVYPMLLSLPMGFSHAVYLAQLGHEHLLYGRGALCAADNVAVISSPLLDRPLHGIYIDDVVGIAPSMESALACYDRIAAVYAASRFPANPKKVVSPTVDPVVALGMTLSGCNGTISLCHVDVLQLITETGRLLSAGYCTGRAMSRLLGSWTWACMVARPGLSVFRSAYRFATVADTKLFQLWPSVKAELMVICCLAPLLMTDLTSPFWDKMVATDASSTGAGVVALSCPDSVARSIWCRSGALLPTGTGIAATDDEVSIDPSVLQTQLLLGEFQPSRFSTAGKLLESHQYGEMVAMDLLSNSGWSTIAAYPWCYADHINRLEAKVVHTALRWYLSCRSSSRPHRLVLFTDSSSVYYALLKGRCTSSNLLAVIRPISALLLASGTKLLPVWCPSAMNPADEPSRIWSHR
jgi:hypothetical protein